MREIMTELQNILRSRHAGRTCRLHFGESRKKKILGAVQSRTLRHSDRHAYARATLDGKRSALTYITQVKAISLDPHEFAVSVTANGIAHSTSVMYKRPY